MSWGTLSVRPGRKALEQHLRRWYLCGYLFAVDEKRRCAVRFSAVKSGGGAVCEAAKGQQIIFVV